MPDLTITVEKAEVVPYSATPMLALKLRVRNASAEEVIHTIILKSQIQIEATRRKYTDVEQEQLQDLFGEPSRWGQNLRNLLWINASNVVPQFTGSTLVDLQIPCTFDFAVATTKYFNGLTDGDIPICLMFSGTVFHADASGSIGVAPISWDKETRYRLPLSLWKDMMSAHYPNTAWLCLRKDVFDELLRYKVERGIPSFEQALETMLASQKEETVRR